MHPTVKAFIEYLIEPEGEPTSRAPADSPPPPSPSPEKPEADRGSMNDTQLPYGFGIRGLL